MIIYWNISDVCGLMHNELQMSNVIVYGNISDALLSLHTIP